MSVLSVTDGNFLRLLYHIKKKKKKGPFPGCPAVEGSCSSHPCGMRSPKIPPESHGLPSRPHLMHLMYFLPEHPEISPRSFSQRQTVPCPRVRCLQGSGWNLADLAWTRSSSWYRMEPGMKREEGSNHRPAIGIQGPPLPGQLPAGTKFKAIRES